MTNRLFVYNNTVGFYLGYMMKINQNKYSDLAQLKLVSADNPEICIITDSMNTSLIDKLYQGIINAMCDQNITSNQNLFDIDYEIKEVHILNDLENNQKTENE